MSSYAPTSGCYSVQADKLHDEAKAKFILARRKYHLLQTFIKISKRAKRRPENLALQNVAMLAEIRMLRFETNRLTEYGLESNVTTLWDPSNYMELLTRKCGLAKAFGLVYTDGCEGLQEDD